MKNMSWRGLKGIAGFLLVVLLVIGMLVSCDINTSNPPSPPGGDEESGSIDLSVFLDGGDVDGLVEASPMVIVGDYLFVALQRLDGFSVVRDAYIAVIDIKTDTLVDVNPGTPEIDPIVLENRNPSFMYYDEVLGLIVVSGTGSYFANDGGIEVVDPSTFQAEGTIIDESTLGADVGAVVIVDGTVGFTVVGGFSANKVVAFDVAVNPGTGEVTGSCGRWVQAAACAGPDDGSTGNEGFRQLERD
jgi:hypothetical protein